MCTWGGPISINLAALGRDPRVFWQNIARDLRVKPEDDDWAKPGDDDQTWPATLVTLGRDPRVFWQNVTRDPRVKPEDDDRVKPGDDDRAWHGSDGIILFEV
jgi:hypothetical protein